MRKSKLKQKGFTLLETLVSLCILGIVTAGTTTAFVQHLKCNLQAELRSGAITAAQQVLDQLRVTDPATLPTSGSSAAQNVTVGSRTYSVQASYCNPTTYCTSSNIRSIHVNVTYNGVAQYEVDTVYAQLR